MKAQIALVVKVPVLRAEAEHPAEAYPAEAFPVEAFPVVAFPAAASPVPDME